MKTVADRLNTLAVESAQTAFDGAQLIQRQNAELVRSYVETLQANQEAGREIIARAFKQAQESQQLYLQLLQETFRTTAETVTRTAGQGLQEVNEQFETARRTAKKSDAA